MTETLMAQLLDSKAGESETCANVPAVPSELLIAFGLLALAVCATLLGIRRWEALEIWEAPSDWLMDKTQVQFIRLTKIGVFAFFAQALNTWMTGLYTAARANLVVGSIVMSLALANQRISLVDRHFTQMIIAALMTIAAISCPLMVEDPVYRNRSAGILLVLWRAATAFGCRMKSCITWLLIGTIAEVFVTWKLFLADGQGGLVRVTVTLVLWSIAGGVWCMGFSRTFRILYESEHDMKVEKEACQSILSMLCDACFWVAADGDTMPEGDKRLESILGFRIAGKRLSQCMPEEERSQFLSLTGRDKNAAHLPVTLLPTSLVRADGPPMCAELFIVDRKSAFTEDEALSSDRSLPALQRGFLVGLRVRQSYECAQPAPHLSNAQGALLEPQGGEDHEEVEMDGTAPTDTSLAGLQRVGEGACPAPICMQTGGAAGAPAQSPDVRWADGVRGIEKLGVALPSVSSACIAPPKADISEERDFETLSKTSLAFSLSGTARSADMQEPLSKARTPFERPQRNVACQTEPVPSARPPRPTAILPSAPRRLQRTSLQASRDGVALGSIAVQHSGDSRRKPRYGVQRCRVSFDATKAFVRRFVPTPDVTIRCLLVDLTQRINPAGRGCCCFHMCLSSISHSLQNLSMGQDTCSNEDAPFDGVWQCKDCQAINLEDEDECVTCGSEVAAGECTPDCPCDGVSGSSYGADRSQAPDDDDQERETTDDEDVDA